MNPSRAGRDLGERLFAFAMRIIRVYQAVAKQSDLGRVLGRQLLRSGTSVGANYEEGQAGQSRADFICKASIALKEARETRYWLRLTEAAEIIPSHRMHELLG